MGPPRTVREQTVVVVNPVNFHGTTAKNKQINAFTAGTTLAEKTLGRGGDERSTCDEPNVTSASLWRSGTRFVRHRLTCRRPVPLVVATAVTNAASNETIVDYGPPPPGFGPPPRPPAGVPTPGAQPTSLNGRVQTSICAGDLNGAVLNDGTIVRCHRRPPISPRAFSPLARASTCKVGN
jgi:hypothetical protein